MLKEKHEEGTNILATIEEWKKHLKSGVFEEEKFTVCLSAVGCTQVSLRPKFMAIDQNVIRELYIAAVKKEIASLEEEFANL